jgi:hypothetical protein
MLAVPPPRAVPRQQADSHPAGKSWRQLAHDDHHLLLALVLQRARCGASFLAEKSFRVTLMSPDCICLSDAIQKRFLRSVLVSVRRALRIAPSSTCSTGDRFPWPLFSLTSSIHPHLHAPSFHKHACRGSRAVPKSCRSSWMWPRRRLDAWPSCSPLPRPSCSSGAPVCCPPPLPSPPLPPYTPHLFIVLFLADCQDRRSRKRAASR